MEKITLNCVVLDESDIPSVDTFVNEHASMELGECEVSLKSITPDEVAGKTKPTDLIALIMRHSDLVSLETVKKAVISLNDENPMGLWILRMEGQKDFKMSCPMCGQKLWVRDSDVNKRGRCPNCKKAFSLPAQCKQVQGLLSLDDSQPVCTVFEQSKISLESAVRAMLSSIGAASEHFHGDLESLGAKAYNQATVQVEIQEEE